MGIRSTLRLVQAVEAMPAPIPTNTARRIATPWAVGTLSTVIVGDVFGTEARGVTRAEAMSLPTVARGRNLLASTISRLPLVAAQGATPLPEQPAWLSTTSGSTSPQHRLAWTVDDLIFTGWSLWATARDTDGTLLDVVRVPRERWTIDAGTSTVLVDDQPADASSVILIPGLHEGILNMGNGRAIRAASTLEETWSERARNPVPAMEVHQETDDQLDDDEIQDLVDNYQEALRRTRGAVLYTPRSLSLKPHGTESTDLLVEGRNASAIDLARLMGLPASMVDASNVNSTLTYETVQGRNREFIDYSVALYTDPIAARLSMDDVTPPGTRITFDTSALTALAPGPLDPALED